MTRFVVPLILLKLRPEQLLKAKVIHTVVSDFGIPWTVACPTPLSMEFSRQECWSGFPFPSPGNLPNPGVKPGSPALQADSLSNKPLGRHKQLLTTLRISTY